jgi:hypothetical protein
MRIIFFTFCLIISSLRVQATYGDNQKADRLSGHRFLTFNTVIRVNQIEVSRNKNVGFNERALHTPEKVTEFRTAIEKGFPGARIT